MKEQFNKANPMMGMMNPMGCGGGDMDAMGSMGMNPMMAVMQQNMMLQQQMMAMMMSGKGDMGGMGKGKGKGKGGKGWDMMGGMGGQSAWKRAMDAINKIDPEKKLYVTGLPEEVKWKELIAHFTEAGHKPGLAETMRNG